MPVHIEQPGAGHCRKGKYNSNRPAINGAKPCWGGDGDRKCKYLDDCLNEYASKPPARREK